jgi:tRNA(Arg) A34 adenosine deaminase TadA
MEEFMRAAIEKTREGIKAGQAPFGACIVKNGEIISCEHNTVWGDTDSTAHAEINAIRKACQKLGTIDLSGCTIYSTTEPCPMCFSAIHWARIGEIVYGTSIADARGAGFSELQISNEEMKKAGECRIVIKRGILKQECKNLFDEWQDKNPRTY